VSFAVGRVFFAVGQVRIAKQGKQKRNSFSSDIGKNILSGFGLRDPTVAPRQDSSFQSQKQLIVRIIEGSKTG
jgi:hypothetical protein